ERLLAGDDALAVELPSRRQCRVGAGGDDDVVGAHLDAAALARRHRERVRAGQLRRALDDLDLAALEQRLHPAGELLHDPLLALEQPAPVDLGLADLDAELLGALDLLEEVGADDPRLGRDAAPVEARAAQLVLFDHRGLEAELRGADRGNVTARTGADDDDLMMTRVAHGGPTLGTATDGVKRARRSPA